MGSSKRKQYRWENAETGELYVVARTWTKKGPGRTLNLWHVMGKDTVLYTFSQNEKYNHKTNWTEELCRKLEADLRSQKPSLNVLRFAVNGKCIFAADPSYESNVPNVPYEKTRAEHEAEKNAVPAPYILYGKHDGLDVEFYWNLTPDKPKRQGIEPGDRVLVWTKKGFAAVTVTRIEKRDGRKKSQPVPTARVKKKMSPEEKVYT